MELNSLRNIIVKAIGLVLITNYKDKSTKISWSEIVKKIINIIYRTLLLLVIPLQSLYAEIINIAVIEYCPYQCNPEKEQGRWGYMPETAKTIFEQSGYSVRFKIVPFIRSIQGTEKGSYDAVLNAHAGHSKSLIFSKEHSGILKQVFFVKRGEPWRYESVQSLEQVRFGYVLGYNASSLWPEFQAYIDENKGNSNKINIVGGSDAPLKNFKKLFAGRITALTEDVALARYLLFKDRTLSITDFEIAGSLGENPQFMGFSPMNPKSQKYADLFDKGIKRMRESGELEKILGSYGIEDWK
jgi:polar amino acid transport system substrate-binding protein